MWPPLHFRRPNPAPKASLEHPDLEASLGAMEFRVHRALPDRKAIQGLRASPARQALRVNPGAMDLQDQPVRQAHRDLRGHLEQWKLKRPSKGSPDLRVPWVLKDRPAQPVHRDPRALPDTRDPKDRRGCLARAASLDHEGSRDLLARWGRLVRLELRDSRGRPVPKDLRELPERSAPSDLQVRPGKSVPQALQVLSGHPALPDRKESRDWQERSCGSSCRNAPLRRDARRDVTRTSILSTAPATVATGSIWMRPECTVSPRAKAQKA